MTQEQKAKRYDEALEKTRKKYNSRSHSSLGPSGVYLNNVDLEEIFPELRESEDERIRKFLFQHISEWIGCIEHDLKNSSKDIESEKELAMFKAGLAYLERQKENPKSADSIPSDCTADAKCEDRWHKVEDSLPDNPREVLCKDEAGNYFIGRYYVGEGWDISNYDDEDKPHHLNPPVLKWIDFPSEKQKEKNGKDGECTDFTIYHPQKNGKGKYECIPFSFYGSLTSFTNDRDLMDFLNESFYDKEECERWCEMENEPELPEGKHKIVDEIAQDYVDGVKEYNPEPTWDLIQTAVCYGANWQMKQFEKNRLANCDAVSKEECDRETDFAMEIIEKEHRQPTFNDAINYGMRLQKEQKPEHFELKAGKWYLCHRAFCCRADILTVQEGERFMCEKDGVVKGFVIKEPEKYFIECSAPAPMENEQQEQKTIKVLYIPKFRTGDLVRSSKNPRLTYKILSVGSMNELGNPEYEVEIFTDGKPDEPRNLKHIEIEKMDSWGELVKQQPVPFSCGHENGKPADSVFSKQEYESHPIISEDTTSTKPVEFDGKTLLYTADKSYQIGFRDGVTSVKSAEWSEEDERIRRNLMSLLANLRVNRITEETYQKYYPWLKSLPERFNLQPKQEWNEEDEKMLNEVLDRVTYAFYDQGNEGEIEDDPAFLWLHRLRPSWKPSEEQMEVLLSTQDMVRSSGYQQNAKVLASLYEQLKRLM